MRAAPLKGDCKICQAPEPTRLAINMAIWPAEGIVRHAEYRARAVAAGLASKPPLAMDPKTVTTHAEHIEASWRELAPGDRWRAGERPLTHDFTSVMDANVRVGARATELIGWLLEEHGDVMAVFQPKFVLDVAAKLGVGAAEKKEAARLKNRGQGEINVLAIFAASAGYARAPGDDAERAATMVRLKADIAAERKLLAERAGR
jgi:hypothetical protein